MKIRMPKGKHHQRGSIFIYLGGVILIIALIAVVFVRYQYDQGLKPVSSSSVSIIVNIPKGDSVSQIADLLKNNGLIRSKLAFQEYIDAQNFRSSLQAGTYSLSPNQGVKKIVSILTSGKISSKLVTILPGQSIAQIQSLLINSGFSPADVSSALQASNYLGTPVLSYKPAGYGLDGLIFPDSYSKDSSTTPSQIIQEALNEMGNKITPTLQASYAREGLSVYQAITMASIMQKEVPDYLDQQQVAQVFLSRIKQNMPLQSNITSLYAQAINNPAYNTYNQPGLPPSPICNVDEKALKAAANPSPTNYLYFVTGRDGVTRFSPDINGQNANIDQFGQKGE
ncbi:MAG: endolytic transglycosylase MltG [bacterium]